MKFTIEPKLFLKLVVAGGEKHPMMRKHDRELQISVLPGVVYVHSSCCAAGAMVSDATKGGCVVPRKEFEEVIRTFKSQPVLTVELGANALGEGVLHINNFSMPVLACPRTAKVPTPSCKWIGPQPKPKRARKASI